MGAAWRAATPFTPASRMSSLQAVEGELGLDPLCRCPILRHLWIVIESGGKKAQVGIEEV